MPKCWSLSIIIRNPERKIPFLRVLKEFEREVFTEEIQVTLFKRLIQTKNYKPMGIVCSLLQLSIGIHLLNYLIF